ncbi:MAG: 2Fe-2S iron-sulfur cluster-binding protein [Acidimicrobiales bacterium]
MADDQSRIELTVDGQPVSVAGTAGGTRLSLLDVLRDQLRITAVKDGCSPQGQCGCCTVLVDGQPRVACVTPARRVAGRSVTTLDGLEPSHRDAWAEAFCATGASQCGFCTPGIIVRLDALAAKLDEASAADHRAVDQALLAHLCRCTGWQTIHEAWDLFRSGSDIGVADRDHAAAAARAELEGGVDQIVGTDVAKGRGRFASDTAPADALVAMPDGAGGWAIGESVAEARAAAGKVQGRRTTAGHQWPIDVPDGTWAATIRTTWVEPAYLETDASWCLPGGDPYTPLANGGAFGAKTGSRVQDAARSLADEHGRSVLAIASREDATRWGAKRPPIAGGVEADGSGVIRVARTPGIAAAIASVAPGIRVEEVDVAGPPTSAAIRAAGWAEAAALLAGGRRQRGWVLAPNGAMAAALIDADTGAISVAVACGPPLDEVVLRSYCVGAAHMAWSWLTSEAITIEPDGSIVDLTIRSFGVIRAVDTPPIDVTIVDRDHRPSERFGGLPGPLPEQPVNGSDAVFAAVAGSGWLSLGCRQDWPISTQLDHIDNLDHTDNEESS